MGKITFTNKQALSSLSHVQEVNKLTDSNINEIKSVVNGNDDLMGDLSNLVTHDKSSIVAAINEAYQKHITTGTINANITLSSGSDRVITLEEQNTIGWLLTYSGGNIVIGEGVSKIMVSAKCQFNSLANDTTNRYLKIKQNGTEVLVSRISPPSGTTGLSIGITPSLLEVTENDEISVSIQGVTNDVLRGSPIWTYITVEVIG